MKPAAGGGILFNPMANDHTIGAIDLSIERYCRRTYKAKRHIGPIEGCLDIVDTICQFDHLIAVEGQG